MSGQAEFETALRHDEPLIEATVVAIQSEQESQGKQIITDKPPPVPDADPDRELIWTVGFSTVRIKLWALLALPAVALNTPLDARNSIVHSVGSTLCMLARSTSPSQFLFSADVAGNYTVEIAVSSIDLEPWARRSNAGERIPVEKLSARLTAGQKLLHNGRADGLTISNTNNTENDAFTALTETFDLDEEKNQTGELHVAMTVTITSGPYGLGFGTELDPTFTFDAVVLASDISALNTFVRGGTPIKGVQIDSSVDLHGTTKLGVLSFYLVKNSDNVLGYVLHYHGGGTDAANVTLGAVLEVAFAPTVAPAATSSSGPSGHVGPLIATLTIPNAVTLAANAYPAALWVLATNEVPDEFSVPSSNGNGKLYVPRILPDTMVGLVVRTKVGSTPVSQVFLPWLPIYEDVAATAQISSGRHGTSVYQLRVSENGDRNAGTLKLVLEREWTARDDLLYVMGNGEAIKAGTSIELYQWV